MLEKLLWGPKIPFVPIGPTTLTRANLRFLRGNLYFYSRFTLCSSQLSPMGPAF
jgi:hypothetical protein